jgi:putative ABC transport system substrate-binding protein
MKRRDLLTLLGGAAASWPLAARAQQPAMPVVGFLGPGTEDTQRRYLAEIHRGLSATGYLVGRNLAVESLWAEDHYDRLPALADELVRRKVSVIIPPNTAASFAAKAATQSIPIVFLTGIDPVGGLVASLNRPGGNLTGVTILLTEVTAKRLELLHELVPAATLIAAFVNPTNAAFAEPERRELQSAARILGLRLLVLDTRDQSEFEMAFATAIGARVGAVLVGGDILFFSHFDMLVALAARYRIPTMFPEREAALVGGLVAYGTDLTTAYNQVGLYAGRVLNGENPSDLPVQQVTKMQLTINMKTAKTLNIVFPTALLVRAEEVIE